MTEAAPALECHDCGEVYPPGVSAAPCAGQGHYVGPVVACELPGPVPVFPLPGRD